MAVTFYISAAVAIFATVMAISRLNAVHALLVVSLISVALVFYSQGAPLIAALEVIIYAGAIVVLFVFVVMMLNLGPVAVEQERQWLSPGMWVGPFLLSAVLLGELAYLFFQGPVQIPSDGVIPPARVGVALFGLYALGVLLASLLLLAGLVGAYHLGRRSTEES